MNNQASTYGLSDTSIMASPTVCAETGSAMSSTQMECRAWAAALGNSLNLQSADGYGGGSSPSIAILLREITLVSYTHLFREHRNKIY